MRTLAQEIVVTKQGDKISMVLHWQGGDHTVLEFMKNKTGHHRHAAPTDVVELVRKLARVQPDPGIVSMNRLGVCTGRGHTWTEARIRSFRDTHNISVYVDGERVDRGELTMEEAAAMLHVSNETVRRLIASKLLRATQACRSAPWIIPRGEIEKMVAQSKADTPPTENVDQLHLKLQ